MMAARNSQMLRTIALLIVVFFASFPAYAKYSGGTGEPNDPYQIATAQDLILLGESPEDYDKHFILTDDIDLDPNLAGRKVFDRGVIGIGWEPAFTGVFDGNGHAIDNLTIDTKGAGNDYLGLFGKVGETGQVKNLAIEDVKIAGGSDSDYLGGLAGSNGDYVSAGGTITNCYSTGSVSGNFSVGGLVGHNVGTISNCYSTSRVSGGTFVGGLVGQNGSRGGLFWPSPWIAGTVVNCYSTGKVSGNAGVGGLVGHNWEGKVTNSFWDIQTSGRATSDGGTVKTTAQMQMASTFAYWSVCSDEAIWTIDEGKDYPRLSWENAPGRAIEANRASDVFIGTGTADDPYLIYTGEEFQMISLMVCDWNKCFKLMADIDLSAYAATGLSTIGVDGIPFTGVFDGNGHTVSNFSYTSTHAYYVGAFGYVTGHIKDLRLIDPDVDAGAGEYVGSLVGELDGRITGCSVEGGSVSGGSNVGGLVGSSPHLIANCYSTGIVSGSHTVGGLVGINGTVFHTGSESWCEVPGSIYGSYSTASVFATGSRSGGLVGLNYPGEINNCYATGSVEGKSNVGGLVGENSSGLCVGSSICKCFSTGRVSGAEYAGGLVGKGGAINCFWDIETSSQTTSAGGTGKTTAQMQMASTFLEAGWDFVGESVNGTDDIWWILEGRSYPRLWWQYGRAFSPHPQDGAIDVTQPLILSWIAGGSNLHHDVYFGDDEQAVANATTETADIYRGRQAADVTTCDPGMLELDRTYYWRIDGVDEADPNSPWKGSVWRFTTANFIVVDDFETYDDFCNRIFYTWLDGWGHSADPECGVTAHPGNGTGWNKGPWWPSAPFAEQGPIVHGGHQSMLGTYDNRGIGGVARYSETERTWDTPQDWTREGVKALTLWVHGDPCNSPQPLYVALQDSPGQVRVATHPEPAAVQAAGWHEWNIDLREFSNAGVDVKSVKKMYIGVGNRNNPQFGGTGRLFIDDIRLYLPRCLPSLLKPEADLSGNCVVDIADIEILAGQWLQSGAGLTADLNADGDVDLGDFARIADAWLEELLWPQP